MTSGELALWEELRGRRLGSRFRRQAPIGSYIVDFVCLRRRLIIEMDGDQHEFSEHDQRRDRYLAEEGFTVIRFWNEDMAWCPQWVVAQIKAALVDGDVDEEVRTTKSVPPEGGRYRRR